MPNKLRPVRPEILTEHLFLTQDERELIASKSPGDESTGGWEYALLFRTVESILLRRLSPTRIVDALVEHAKECSSDECSACSCGWDSDAEFVPGGGVRLHAEHVTHVLTRES